MMDSFWNVILFNGLVLFIAEGNGLAYEALNLESVLKTVLEDWMPGNFGAKMLAKKNILDKISVFGFLLNIAGRLSVIVAGVVLFGTYSDFYFLENLIFYVGDSSTQCTYLASNQYQAPTGSDISTPLGAFNIILHHHKPNNTINRPILESAARHYAGSRGVRHVVGD